MNHGMARGGLLLASLTILLCLTAAGGAVPPGWQFRLPAGDPTRGEAVFVRMKCGACHTVAGRDIGGVRPETGMVGPDLTGALAGQPAELLAERLITYDRFLPHGMFKATYSRSDASSRMANYNEDLTVRDLIDLVTWLRSIEPAGRP